MDDNLSLLYHRFYFTYPSSNWLKAGAEPWKGSNAIGKTLLIALARMYKTPVVPHSDATIVARPLAGELLLLSSLPSVLVAARFVAAPPRGVKRAELQNASFAAAVVVVVLVDDADRIFGVTTLATRPVEEDRRHVADGL